MAKKKAATASVPTAEKVTKALTKGDFVDALTLSRELHTLTPTPENAEVRKKAIIAAAEHFAERNKYADFNRIMDEAAAFAPDDASWKTERAILLARGGKLHEALALADADAQLKVLGHGVDRAIRLQSPESLPEEHRAGYDAVLSAFQHHERGDEAKAREAIEPFGLRSPFLEWKMLLRGLLAHASGDDARATENWKRLDPARMPSRLAATVNATLSALPLVTGLRAIARELGGGRAMRPAFHAVEAVLPQLKKDAPHLVPRLANCLYHALVKQGQPDDLPRYRKLFGSPPNDPEFHRLQAQIYEQIRSPEAAHTHWKKYEEWLGANPRNWPPAIAARARAVVWVRMGENAEEVEKRRKARDEESFDFEFGPPRHKLRPLDPPPEACFRRAAELAPDWPVAVQGLFESLVEAEKPAEAEAAARAYLVRDPNYLPALVALAQLLQKQSRAAEAVELWLRAAAVNPLDKMNRLNAALAVLANARLALVKGQDAEAVLSQHDSLLKEFTPGATPALRAVIATKNGKPDEAAAFRTQALAAPGLRLASALRMAVDSTLAKVKPADKRAADKLLAEELAKLPKPVEVIQALTAWDSYTAEGISYRGQKTHGTKILDLAPKTATADAPEFEFESLCESLLLKQQLKQALKLIDACRRRFPNNPMFIVQRVQISLERGERMWTVEGMLRNAKKLAEKSPEQRHRDLGNRIDELFQQIQSPFDVLFGGGFFGDE